MLLNIIGSLLLSSDAKALGESLKNSGITGAEVVGRGTIIVDGKIVAQSKEFVKLKQDIRKTYNKLFLQ